MANKIQVRVVIKGRVQTREITPLTHFKIFEIRY